MDLASLALGLGASGLALAACALVLTLRATPRKLTRALDALGHEVSSARAELDQARAERVEHRKQVDLVYEAVQDDLERAETKRRQAAARRSKANGPAQPEVDWNDRGTLLRLARERGEAV